MGVTVLAQYDLLMLCVSVMQPQISKTTKELH